MPFALPPDPRKTDGSMRRVGVELEYAGVSLQDAAAIVQSTFGGDVERVDAFKQLVRDTPHGDFTLELDSSMLQDKGYMNWLSALGVKLSETDKASLERFLRDVADEFIPYEIVAPPIPMDQLDPLDDMREALRLKRAEGVGKSILYAFGMQFNVEPPDLEPATITWTLKAFLLTYPWLREAAAPDVTRALSPFIDSFPRRYVGLVCHPEYAPQSMGALIDDYLEHSPTRNRPLDFLPLFAHLDEQRVLQKAKEPELIKPRPALHYRLPNSMVDDPDWRISQEWDLWLVLEKLAASPEKVDAMCADFQQTPGFPLDLIEPSWKEKVASWLDR